MVLNKNDEKVQTKYLKLEKRRPGHAAWGTVLAKMFKALSSIRKKILESRKRINTM